MSAANSTLFGRLKELRTTATSMRTQLDVLRKSISMKSETADCDDADWPATDMYRQLGSALQDLDSLIGYLKPLPEHLDQPMRAASSKKRTPEVHS